MNLPVIHLDRSNAALVPNNQVVEFFADLQPFGDHLNEYWQVDKPSGLRFLFTYKASGIYKAEATEWRKINNFQLIFNDGEFAVTNAADGTKVIAFDISQITTATKRTATWQDKDGIVAYKIGIQSFFLEAKGSFGTGGGWADSGLINDTPVLFFASNVTERAIYMFFGMARFKFDSIDPQIGFIIYSTSAPSLGSDDVRWELETRYVAETESAGKPPDETILQTQNFATLVLNTRQSILLFTLDRSLISDQDVMKFTLSRIGGDGLDNYGSNVGVGQAGIIIETLDVNP